MFVKSLALLAAVFLSAVCRATPAHSDSPAERKDCVVVLIAGFDSDPSEQQLIGKAPRGRGNSGMFQLAGDLKVLGFTTEFFNWSGTRAGRISQQDPPGASRITKFIRTKASEKQIGRLVLIGHSWGAHTMLQVAAALSEKPETKVELAIGVDPSSFGRGERAQALPASIGRFVNYHTRNAFVWGPWKEEQRVENVDLGAADSPFMKSSHANYSAKLDIGAHNAAEWDPLIHSDIVRRIKALSDAEPDNGKTSTK